MLSISELAKRIDPVSTILFLGAGASIPSGCPSGVALSKALVDRLDRDSKYGDDLAETASLLEMKFGRRRLIEEIAAVLADSEPSQGVLVFPEFPWKAIYTTNFDTIVERAYAKCGVPLPTVRSNFDYNADEVLTGTSLFKIHGCISQDRALGHKSSIVLTEADYREHDEYRQVLYNRMQMDLLTASVVLIGQSLRDPHLKREADRAAEIQRQYGAPGRLFILVYDSDETRAQLYEAKGYQVAFGGIDNLMDALSEVGLPTKVPSSNSATSEATAYSLPVRLRAATIDVGTARTRQSALKLFHGLPATYADIEAGITFKRSAEFRLKESVAGNNLATVVIGSAGVGKSTLLRRIAFQLSQTGMQVWEHHSDFPLRSEEWLAWARSEAVDGRRSVLVIDDCTRYQRQLNHLINGLADHELRTLHLLLAAPTNEWEPRQKSSNLFSRSWIEHLSELDEEEIRSLLTLATNKNDIRKLVQGQFKRQSFNEQVRSLKKRCHADMFVCLKNIFAVDGLDTIILREYAELDENIADVYRYVAALEAAGTRPDRWMIMEMLRMHASDVSNHLKALTDIIEERELSSARGIYIWYTRHEVVARVLARYKFSDEDELYRTLQLAIEKLNPTVYVQQRALRDLCSSEFGIKRLSDSQRRRELYTLLLDIAPSERVTRHRLVGEYLADGQLELAETALRDATETVGWDPPLHRYNIKLLIQRATQLDRVLLEDRLALLREAWREAVKGVDRYRDNKYAYFVLSDVAIAWKETTGEDEWIHAALSHLKLAAELILDPDLASHIRRMERECGD